MEPVTQHPAAPRGAAALRWLAVLVLLAPVPLHLVGRGGEGLVLVLLSALAPAALGLAAARRAAPDRRALEAVEVALLTAFGAAFVVPLLPAVLGVDGFAAAPVPVHGALAFLVATAPAWRATPAAGGTWPRALLFVWAAWSVGSALRGYLALVPELPGGAPWQGELLGGLALDPFGARSLVDPARPFGQLLLRLETLGLAAAALEVGLAARARGELAALGRRMAACLTWILAAGLALAVVEFVVAARWRGDGSALARAAEGIGRNYRPLLDHNALGTALVVLLPLAVAHLVASLSTLVRRGTTAAEPADRAARVTSGTVAGAGLATLLGVLLLVSSRSKSALGATALALAVLACTWVLARGGRARRVVLAVAAAALLAVVGLNLAPDGPGSAVERLASTRYGHDLVRVVRLDAMADYARENRATIWRGARAVGDEAPLVGVGLGNLPRLLPEHHDPTDPGWFNPRSENAHSQYLQVYAEEGLAGLALGLVVLGAALVVGLRRGLGRAGEPAGLDDARRALDPVALAGAAGLVGLGLNLVLGHGLLDPATAFLVAVPTGWLLAGAGGPAPRPRATGLAAAAALVLALAPLALPGGRRPLAPTAWTLGCYAWDFLPGQAPDRARTLAPDARWLEVWGAGDVLKLPVRDVRDPRFPGRITLDLWVDGERMIEGRVLPHNGLEELARDPDLPVNPLAFLRVERPAHVAPGDLVELRLVASEHFVGSRVFSPDHRRVAVRVLPAFFD